MNLIVQVQGSNDSSNRVRLFVLRDGRSETLMTRVELRSLIEALHTECALLAQVSPGDVIALNILPSNSNES